MVKSLYAFCANSKVIRRIYFTAKHCVIGLVSRGLHVLTRLRVFEPDEAVLARAESVLMRAVALGKEGRFKVVPEFISVSATENCNLECVMCPSHAGMLGPNLPVDEAGMLFSSLADKDVSYRRPKFLDMTSGEPTLNRNLDTIHSRFKDLFQNGKILIVSHTTLAVRGSVRKAFEHADMIGLSTDGATA